MVILFSFIHESIASKKTNNLYQIIKQYASNFSFFSLFTDRNNEGITFEAENPIIEEIENSELLTIMYDNSNTIDKVLHNEGDEVTILDYEGENKDLFLGWSLEKDGKVDYVKDDIITIKENIVLYPIFDIATPSINEETEDTTDNNNLPTNSEEESTSDEEESSDEDESSSNEETDDSAEEQEEQTESDSSDVSDNETSEIEE